VKYSHNNWYIKQGQTTFTSAPLVLNLSELVGEETARKALKFNEGASVDEKSPYAGGYNLVLRNIKCDAAIFDVPIYYKQIGGGDFENILVVKSFTRIRIRICQKHHRSPQNRNYLTKNQI